MDVPLYCGSGMGQEAEQGGFTEHFKVAGELVNYAKAYGQGCWVAGPPLEFIKGHL